MSTQPDVVSVETAPETPAPRREKALNLDTMTHWHKRVLYEEVARRVLERHGPERICFDLAISRNTMRAILKTEEFKQTFEALRLRIVEPVEAAIRDERMNLTERVSHGSQRALSKLFHLLENAKSEAVQERVAGRLLDKVVPDAKPATVVADDTIKLDKETATFLGSVLHSAMSRGHVLLPTSSPSPTTVDAQVVPDSSTSATRDESTGGADPDPAPDHRPPLFSDAVSDEP